MPVAWFFVPYKRRDIIPGRPGRYCAMDDFTEQIRADPEYQGGEPWSECECLGDQAVVKVRASSVLLSTINAAPGFQRVPARFTDLSQTLGNLTTQERTQLNNKLLSLGYTQAEINAAVGSTNGQWRAKTLRQLLRFVLSRRRLPRYDDVNDLIVLDGDVDACRDVDDADAVVA
jgi:hypothetical protein